MYFIILTQTINFIPRIIPVIWSGEKRKWVHRVQNFSLHRDLIEFIKYKKKRGVERVNRLTWKYNHSWNSFGNRWAKFNFFEVDSVHLKFNIFIHLRIIRTYFWRIHWSLTRVKLISILLLGRSYIRAYHTLCNVAQIIWNSQEYNGQIFPWRCPSCLVCLAILASICNTKCIYCIRKWKEKRINSIESPRIKPFQPWITMILHSFSHDSWNTAHIFLSLNSIVLRGSRIWVWFKYSGYSPWYIYSSYYHTSYFFFFSPFCLLIHSTELLAIIILKYLWAIFSMVYTIWEPCEYSTYHEYNNFVTERKKKSKKKWLNIWWR